MSRLKENGKSVPRLVDVRALLDLYLGPKPAESAQDVRERVLLLAAEGRKEEWFGPFRDVMSGDMTSVHMQRFVAFETDAEEILSYEAEFVFGLLQTAGYARAVAELFFPDGTPRERERFVAFRLARQERLAAGKAQLKLRAAIRRRPRCDARSARLRSVVASFEFLVNEVRNGRDSVEIRIVPDMLPPSSGHARRSLHRHALPRIQR